MAGGERAEAKGRSKAERTREQRLLIQLKPRNIRPRFLVSVFLPFLRSLDEKFRFMAAPAAPSISPDIAHAAIL